MVFACWVLSLIPALAYLKHSQPIGQCSPVSDQTDAMRSEYWLVAGILLSALLLRVYNIADLQIELWNDLMNMGLEARKFTGQSPPPLF